MLHNVSFQPYDILEKKDYGDCKKISDSHRLEQREGCVE